jgi:hypothetical protein
MAQEMTMMPRFRWTLTTTTATARSAGTAAARQSVAPPSSNASTPAVRTTRTALGRRQSWKEQVAIVLHAVVVD